MSLPKTEAIERGLELCKVLHEGQIRKGNGEPYARHPERVAEKIYEALDIEYVDEELEALIVATLLHDTIEDCDITKDELLEKLEDHPRKNEVIHLVQAVTNPEKWEGNRRYRMGVVRDKMRTAPVEVKLIKASDRLDNLQDIKQFDKGFRKKYYQESEDLYEALTENIPSFHPYRDALFDILDELDERLDEIKAELYGR